MLNLKIKRYDRYDAWDDLKLSDIYVSNTMSLISGYTDQFAPIMTGTGVRMVDVDGKETLFASNVQEVSRNGYVEYKVLTEVHKAVKTLNTTVENESTSTESTSNVRQISSDYVIWHDAVYYRYTNTNNYDFNPSTDYAVDGYFINGIYYPHDDNGILINERVYINDYIVFIGEMPFNVYFLPDSNNGHWGIKYSSDSVEIETINDQPISIVIYDRSEVVKEVVLYSSEDEIIKVTSATCGSYRYFVNIGGDGYEVYEVTDSESPNYGKFVINIDGVEHIAFDDYTGIEITSYNELDGAAILNEEGDGYIGYAHSVLTSGPSGDFLLLFTEEENILAEGMILNAKCSVTSADKILITSSVTDNHTYYYAEVNGELHEVKPHMFDRITYGGQEFVLHYTDSAYTQAYIESEYENVEFEVSRNILTGVYTAKCKRPMFVRVKKTSSNNVSVMTEYVTQTYSGMNQIMRSEYGQGVKWESGYTVTLASGVTINGFDYEVFKTQGFSISNADPGTIGPTTGQPITYNTSLQQNTLSITTETAINAPILDDDTTETYIVYDGAKSYMIQVDEVIGAGMAKCSPFLDNYTINRIHIGNEEPLPDQGNHYFESFGNAYDEDIVGEIAESISNESGEVLWSIMNGPLKRRVILPENGLVYAWESNAPTSSFDVIGFGRGIRFEYEASYISFNIPITQNAMSDYLKEDLAEHKLVEDMSSVEVNKIIDMEKMPYRLSHIEIKNGEYQFVTFLEKFSIVPNIPIPFVANDNGSVPENVKRSFIRLSFFDSTDSQHQFLLGTMCMTFGGASIPNYNGIGGAIYEEEWGNDPNDVESMITIKKFTVYNNTYGAITTSELFRLYTYKDMYDTSDPIDIFMRIDFNDAKTGNVTPLGRYEQVNVLDTSGPTLIDAIYFPFTMYYDKGLRKYVFAPKISALANQQTVGYMNGNWQYNEYEHSATLFCYPTEVIK